MNIKMIKSLAGIMIDSDLSSIEVEENGLKLKLTRDRAAEIAQTQLSAREDKKEKPKASEAPDESGMDFNSVHAITSPMVGVFYQAAGPGEKPFVQIGSKVKKGDVLCIIEAMKLLNEVNAVSDGEIVDVCVSDGDVVEFGQTLFKIF